MHKVRSFVRRRPKLAVLLVVVLALVFAGVGYALWTMTTTTNKLEGQTAGTIPLTIINPTSGDLSAAQQCAPGGSCPILGEVSNPSSTAIQITAYQPTSAGGFDNGASLTCDSSNFTGPAETSALTTLGTPITVAAGASNVVVTLPNALTLKATAPTACEGQVIKESSGSITLTYTAGS